MRFLVITLLAVGLAGCQSAPPAPPETKFTVTAEEQASVAKGDPLDTLLIQSPAGNVVFTHKKHFERVNNDCSVCHPKVFPQALAPLDYKKAKHRAAEASYKSCATCHAVGASSFAADSNCTRCHAPKEH